MIELFCGTTIVAITVVDFDFFMIAGEIFVEIDRHTGSKIELVMSLMLNGFRERHFSSSCSTDFFCTTYIVYIYCIHTIYRANTSFC